MRWSTARVLASAFLAGTWTADEMLARAHYVLVAKPRWLKKLVAEVLARFPTPPHDARDDVARLIVTRPRVRIVRPLFDTPEMRATPFEVPPLATIGAIAEHLAIDQIDWFADRKGLERFAEGEPLRHYRYKWVPKRSGGVRLLEQPKPRLRAIQRRVLHEILDRAPPHDAAHAFRAGRSVVTCAARHAGRYVVIRFDLADFFASIRIERVNAIFHGLGYPDEAARTLAGLCTNWAPAKVIADLPHARRLQLAYPHLPQGAPTSPALANLAAFPLDVRLSALARSMSASYTRYADDLFFSGDAALARAADRLHALVGAIALEEGFELNYRKTRVMRQGVRQRVTSIVVNAHPNVDRPAFDRLKAILTNCIRHSPASQNRDGVADFRAHLAGRVAWVSSVAPARGERLAALFDRIVW